MVTQLGKFEARKTEVEGGFFCVVFVPDRENSVPLVVVAGLSEYNATDLANRLNTEIMNFRFEI